MPIVTMPNGDDVDFPDDWSKDKIRGLIEKKFPKEAAQYRAEKGTTSDKSLGDTAADTLISAGSGVTKGTLALGELPQDLAHLARVGADKLGIDTSGIRQGLNNSGLNPLTLSRKVKDFANSDNFVANYARYKPETTVGKYSKSVGEFAPAAVGGGEGLGLRALKYAVAPGLASEGLGQLAEKVSPDSPGLAQGARALGGLVGLAGGAALLNRGGEALVRRAIPTSQQYEQAGSAAYDAARQSGVMIRDNTMQRLKSGLSQHLDDLGFLPGSETKASAALDRIYRDLDRNSSRVLTGRGNQTNFGQRPHDLVEFDKIGSQIGKKIKDLSPLDKGDRRILWAAKHYVDDFAQNLRPKDIIAGDLPRGLAALRDAKQFWRTKSKGELLDQIERNANDSGHAVYTRGGEELATRREVLKFLRKDPNKRQSLTDPELAAMRRVSHGTHFGNAARWVGKAAGAPLTLAGSGSVGGGLGWLAGGPVGAFVGAGTAGGAGILGKYLSKRSTQKALNDARSIILNHGKRLHRGYKTKTGTILTLSELLNR